MSPPTQRKKGKAFFYLGLFLGGMMVVHTPLAYKVMDVQSEARSLLSAWLRHEARWTYHLSIFKTSPFLKKNHGVWFKCVLFFVFLLSSKGMFQWQIEIPFDLRKIWRQFQHVEVIWKGFCVAWEEEAADLKSLARAEPGRHSFWGRNRQTANPTTFHLNVRCDMCFGRIYGTLFWNILLKSYKRFED